MWTKVKAGAAWLFGTHKGRAYNNGFCAVLWCISAYNTAGTSPMSAGVFALLAALFGGLAGQNIADHVYTPMLKAYRDISDASLDIIRDMREKLNEQDDEIERLRQELEETYS